MDSGRRSSQEVLHHQMRKEETFSKYHRVPGTWLDAVSAHSYPPSILKISLLIICEDKIAFSLFSLFSHSVTQIRHMLNFLILNLLISQCSIRGFFFFFFF